MDQSKSTREPSEPNLTALPNVVNMQSAPRPHTCDSSATTLPPSSIPNTQELPISASDNPIATLLSAVAATNKALPSTTNLQHQKASAQPRAVNGQAIAEDQADKVNAKSAVEPHVEELVRKSQKGKRRAPPQGSKAKRPRLGPSQASLKKCAKGPARKARPRPVKSKKASAVQGAHKKGAKNAQNTEKAPNEAVKASAVAEIAPAKSPRNASHEIVIQVGCSANDEGTLSADRASIAPASFSEVGEIDKTEKDSSQPLGKTDGSSAGGATTGTAGIDGRGTGKERNASQTNGKASTNEGGCIEKEMQASYDVPSAQGAEEQQKGKEIGISRSCNDRRGKESQCHDASASDGKNKCGTAGSDAQEEASLKEKYEDLSRRYLSLVRGVVASGRGKKGEDSGDSDIEGGDGGAQTEMVDKKVYDAIYLCKVAGMLGAMKIEGGLSDYVGAKRLRRVGEGYKVVLKDGFEFVEDLMGLGEPDENSLHCVKGVFRDVHVRLMKDVWARNEDKGVAKTLLVDIVTMIGEQVRMWYMKIMDGKINVLWSEVVAVKLVEGVYKNAVTMDEEISEEVVRWLRGLLKYIAEYYEECERKVEKACLEKFCYSCEVSISIARSVPQAALTLEEEVAYTIGRHNGVFSHCVSRLLAEQEAKDGGGGTGTASGK